MTTGLIQSLGTEWGLLRHNWIAPKFILPIIAATALLIHMKTASRMASLAAATLPGTDYRPGRIQLIVHAADVRQLEMHRAHLEVGRPHPYDGNQPGRVARPPPRPIATCFRSWGYASLDRL